MNKLDQDAVAQIRSAKSLYKSADVARHYGVHPSTVLRVWKGELYAGVRPANEPPNIITKPRPSELYDDIRILLGRGFSPQEVADKLGISKSSVYACGKGIFT